MDNFTDKVAFITGGAAGIGYGIAEALVAEGMKVMLADIEEETLAKAVETLKGQGADVAGVVCDVSRAEAITEAAQKTIETFGKVHVLVNNAGVGGGTGDTGSIGLKDWRWTVDVNLMGVAYGCEIFVPLIKSHGEGGYIVNTASMAGQVGVASMGPYNATKFAVVGYSESLYQELAPHNIGVSALCPGWVATNIHKSRRNHPDAGARDNLVGNADPGMFDLLATVIEGGMSAEVLGKWVVENMRKNALYIFTHPTMREGVTQRQQMINDAWEACEASPLIRSDKATSGDGEGNDAGVELLRERSEA